MGGKGGGGEGVGGREERKWVNEREGIEGGRRGSGKPRGKEERKMGKREGGKRETGKAREEIGKGEGGRRGSGKARGRRKGTGRR